MTSDAAVHAEGLVKHFGEVVALDGIDLTVERGQVVGLLGPHPVDAAAADLGHGDRLGIRCRQASR
jgi:ABC-type lipopolysaccharide export system ATPase subunit